MAQATRRCGGVRRRWRGGWGGAISSRRGASACCERCAWACMCAPHHRETIMYGPTARRRLDMAGDEDVIQSLTPSLLCCRRCSLTAVTSLTPAPRAVASVATSSGALITAPSQRPALILPRAHVRRRLGGATASAGARSLVATTLLYAVTKPLDSMSDPWFCPRRSCVHDYTLP
jgi:hypothetical protein